MHLIANSPAPTTAAMVHGRWRAIGGPACVVQGKVGMRCCDLLCIGEAHKGVVPWVRAWGACAA